MDSAQPQDELLSLKEQILKASLSDSLKERLTNQLTRVELISKATGFALELQRQIDYLKFMVNLPFNSSSQDILDVKRTEGILDQNHFGLTQVKNRILEYIAVLILNARQGIQPHAPILAFVGLVGSGKTSLAFSIAQSLSRKIIRIPFGGLGSISQLKGISQANLEAEPGQIIKGIAKVGVNNPVILLDEIDRTATEARADIMGVLVELLDPGQNTTFLDYYVDYSFDLSKAMFIATANNTTNIATAVLDRLEIIEMPAYSDQEKIIIGKNYLLPQALKDSGVKKDVVIINEDFWPKLVRPLGYDGGIRSLQRTVYGIARKVARQVVEGNPGPFKIDETNISQYLQ